MRIVSIGRKLAVAAMLCAAFTQGHAEEARDRAVGAGLADGVSTALGLAAGAVEMNPLGPVLAIGMKTVAINYADTLPDTERPAVYAAAESLWSGAAANNVCITAALLSGGSFAPACVLVGVAWGMKTWQQTEHERAFWEGCALLRQYAQEPELKCVYTAPAPEPMVASTPVQQTAWAIEMP